MLPHVPKAGGSWVQAVFGGLWFVDKPLRMHEHIDLVRLEHDGEIEVGFSLRLD